MNLRLANNASAYVEVATAKRSFGGNSELRRTVEAVLFRGSDYPVAYAAGVKIDLELDTDTNNVIVTRGRGLVKLAYLIGAAVTPIAKGLACGCRYTGHIERVAIGPAGKMLQIRLDRPCSPTP